MNKIIANSGNVLRTAMLKPTESVRNIRFKSNIGTGNIGTGNIGTGNMGAGNMGAGNIGAGNMGAGNMGAGNMGAGNMGAGNVNSLRDKHAKVVPSKPTVYIVDFLNIFSDFREIKYKKINVDFHSVKHSNKEQDTYDFFKLFFSKYIDYVRIDPNSQFYFVMKKLNDYEIILDNIMKTHEKFNMKFIIIEDKYNNDILDKNKDDFLCQYFFYVLQKQHNCILISNDKYRDKRSYIKLFKFDIYIRVVNYNKTTGSLEKSTLKIRITDSIGDNILLQKYTRCTIPKRDLNLIL